LNSRFMESPSIHSLTLVLFGRLPERKSTPLFQQPIVMKLRFFLSRPFLPTPVSRFSVEVCNFLLITLERHTTVGRTPLDEGSARRRGLYLTTTHNTASYRIVCSSIAVVPKLFGPLPPWFHMHTHSAPLLFFKKT
jgi:hypothetical protein